MPTKSKAKKPAKKAAKRNVRGTNAPDVYMPKNPIAYPKKKKAAKKGRAKSAETGKFVKKDFAAKNAATTYITKSKPKDNLKDKIKAILDDYNLTQVKKLACIAELVYKK